MEKRTGKFQSGILIGIVIAAAVLAGVLAFILFDTSGTMADLPQEYVYDISKYTDIDPDLILYRQVGETIRLDFQTTQAISVGSDSKMYIAGDDKIEIHTPGISITIQSVFSGEPTCIQSQQDGTILVGLKNSISIVDSYGKQQDRWTVPAENAILTSLAYNKDSVFAADAVNKVVWKFDRQGNVVGKIGEKNSDRNIPGFVVPSPYFDIAMAADGLLRIVNPGRHQIEAYTIDGDREWAWGKPSVSVEGFSGCCNPINFAILPDGGFVTCEKGLVRIKEYTADGQFVGVVAGPQQLEWDQPQQVCQTPEECSAKGFDVAVGPNGRIYVLDMVRHIVRIFEKK